MFEVLKSEGKAVIAVEDFGRRRRDMYTVESGDLIGDWYQIQKT